MTATLLERNETTTHKTKQRVYRGEIWNVVLPESGRCVQKGERPFLILSNNIGNRFSPIVFGYPLTSKTKKQLPTHTKLEAAEGFLAQDSFVLAEQPITISVDNLKNKICTISEEKLVEVEFAHFISFGLLDRYEIIPKKKQMVI